MAQNSNIYCSLCCKKIEECGCNRAEEIEKKVTAPEETKTSDSTTTK